MNPLLFLVVNICSPDISTRSQYVKTFVKLINDYLEGAYEDFIVIDLKPYGKPSPTSDPLLSPDTPGQSLVWSKRFRSSSFPRSDFKFLQVLSIFP